MCSNDLGASIGYVSTTITPLAVSMRKTGVLAAGFAGPAADGLAPCGAAGLGAWAATVAPSARAQMRTFAWRMAGLYRGARAHRSTEGTSALPHLRHADARTQAQHRAARTQRVDGLA